MQSERGAPVMGAAVGMLGCISALEVLKLIAGIGETLTGRLLIVDGLGGRFREMTAERNPGCPVCGAV
jgi:adenylyltransferase/sulfurtransferase